ncbi:hypothetical protein T01_12280 [Trichinella spiralis]|uniref:Secreted protein n=1 Tax=Trichinella spiralis TaxID=6334 RepID=A0A0V1B585_TRISP|nr:hypothetical protein T01_12280 [Trichinella spiralis]
MKLAMRQSICRKVVFVIIAAQLFSHSSSSTTITNPTTPATDGRSCQVTTAADQHPLGMPPIPPLSPFVAAFPADLSAKTTCDIRHSLLMA